MSEKHFNADYTQATVFFQIRKALRYIRLYGLPQTLARIKGQYHRKATADFDGKRWINPDCKSPNADSRIVAIIGCGNYAFSNIAYYLNKHNNKFLRCVYSPGNHRAMSLCKSYCGAYATSDWREILSDVRVKIVFIASNNASHADYAIACIEAGKNVHIEKPHVVTQDELTRLIDAMKRNPKSKVFLGFSRPRSHLFRRLQDLVARESGALMVNWFIAMHSIDDREPIFDEKEGGRVLGHICHWTDLILHLVTMEKAFPCTIVPATPKCTKSDFMVSIMFSDQSCASITLSAKTHIFEGMREVLNLHKGNLLANLTDFHLLSVDLVEKKKAIRLLHRDYGHEANIVHSFTSATDNEHAGENRQYVSATARLFLAVREAIDSGRAVVLSREEAIGGLE